MFGHIELISPSLAVTCIYVIFFFWSNIPKIYVNTAKTKPSFIEGHPLGIVIVIFIIPLQGLNAALFSHSVVSDSLQPHGL